MKYILLGIIIGFGLAFAFIIATPLLGEFIDDYEATVERIEEHKEWKRKRKEKALVEVEEGGKEC